MRANQGMMGKRRLSDERMGCGFEPGEWDRKYFMQRAQHVGREALGGEWKVLVEVIWASELACSG